MAQLSILELATVGSGKTTGQALEESVAMVQAAEAAGYHRCWVAEHHGMAGVASSAPAVLLAHLAAKTSTIRVGSGGVMLPNHAPLVVAEQFGTLEALHPHRIDLGLGRAPGTDQRTARALGRGNADRFPEDVVELVSYFTGTSQVLAMPGKDLLPEIWLLGSSTYSATLAAHLGLPFAFAYHFAPDLLDAAVSLYRSNFTPSFLLGEPRVMVAATVLCADSDAEAEQLAIPSRLATLLLRTGKPAQFPSPQEAAAYPFTAAEEALCNAAAASHIIGGPATVKAGIDALVERTGADEIMVSTRVYDVADRIRSIQRIAEACAA